MVVVVVVVTPAAFFLGSVYSGRTSSYSWCLRVFLQLPDQQTL